MSVDFSIIIPWQSGDPTREESLKNLLKCLKVQDGTFTVRLPISFELVIVEQVTSQTSYQANKKIKEILPQEFAGAKYIQLIHDNPSFNKSWCMNVGIKSAYHDHILFMDADSLFGKDYLSVIVDHIQNTNDALNKVMICWNTLICLPGRDNPAIRYVRPEITCALGGIWYTYRPYFISVLGGMNENYASYGGEDNDIYERAVLAQKHPLTIIPYTLAHQYHHWQKQAKNADHLFNISRQNCLAITERLKSTTIGNPEHPTLIDMDDLPWT